MLVLGVGRPVLAVDNSLYHLVGLGYCDEALFFEFFEAVPDSVGFEGGFRGDFLGVVSAFCDVVEDCFIDFP